MHLQCRRLYWTASLIVQNWLLNGKESSKLLLPRAQVKARRVTTKRVQKEVVPPSLDQEASNIHQVRIHFLNSSFLLTLLNRPAFFIGRHREHLQQGRANTSGKPEPGHSRESCGDGCYSGQSPRPARAGCYNVSYQSFLGEGISYS
jgi:hypothetical protein